MGSFCTYFLYVLCVWCIWNPLGIGCALATSSGSTSVFGIGNYIDDTDGISKFAALLNSFGVITEIFSKCIALDTSSSLYHQPRPLTLPHDELYYNVITLNNKVLNKRGEVKINGGSEIFVKFNKRRVGIGISKYPLISVMNEKRDINV